MARPVRVLLMTSNGFGMGHLSRMLAVALAAGERLDPVMLSLSLAFPVVAAHGLRGEYCPSAERDLMPRHVWHRYLRRRLVALARETEAEVIAFDGVVPYPGLVAAAGDLADVGLAWVRRGMWQPGADDVRLSRAGQFDIVVEPGDLAAGGDGGPTATRTDAVRVAPVTLLDVVDRLDRATAATALGIDPDRPTALVTLRTVLTGGATAPGAVAVDTLLADPRWQVCVTRSSFDVGSSPAVPRVTELRGVYPLASYLSAFDVAVSTAGYNSVHELVPAGIPSVLIPNPAARTDDQRARAAWLARAGLALTAVPDRPDEVAAAVEMLGDDAMRADLGSVIGALPQAAYSGGAAATAGLLAGLASAHPVRGGLVPRAQRAATAGREAAKQALGAANADRLRRLLGRPETGGPVRRLQVHVVGEPSPPRRAGDVRPLVLSETIPAEDIASGPVVEHLLPGSSERYRAERRAIIDDYYRVVPG